MSLLQYIQDKGIHACMHLDTSMHERAHTHTNTHTHACAYLREKMTLLKPQTPFLEPII